MRMILAPAMACIALIAAPCALAGTLQEVTTKGIIASVAGFDIDISFTPDGKFNGMDGMFTGTWRIDGQKLCLTGDSDKVETCTEYPSDKKSGDKFDVDSPQGVLTIQIK